MEDENNDDRRHQRHQDDDASERSEDEASDDEFSLDEDDLALMETRTAQAMLEAELKVKECRKAHQRRVQITSLKINARHTWGTLPRNMRTTHVPTILFCLKQPAEKIPDCMHWKDFDRTFPNTVQSNKVVLLARLERQAPGFDNLYKYNAYPVPNNLRGDEEVMLALCQRSPRTMSFATKKLQDG